MYVFPDIYGLLLSRIVAREPCCCWLSGGTNEIIIFVINCIV